MIPLRTNKALLVLAPHLEYPVRSGADIAIDKKYSLFSRWLPRVTILAKDRIVEYRDGECSSNTPFTNRGRSPSEAAVRTLLNRSHYHLEKFLTPVFRKRAKTLMQDPETGNILFSYICTASLLADENREMCCMVETHNDDFLWFEQLEQNTRNPLGKRVARLSLAWTKRFLTEHATNLLYIHVTPSDWHGYDAHIPGHPHLVIPIGVDVENSSPDYEPTKTDFPVLLFVGSLNVNMNLDALQHFKTKFYPSLKSAFGSNLAVRVAGRTPSVGVKNLCYENNWELFPDVTEEELNTLYAGATFAILPFAYATGAKLKLLKTLSRGVPFLATPDAFTQVAPDLPHCLVSDDPEIWKTHVVKTLESGIKKTERTALREHASTFSWDSVARKVFTDLVNLHDENMD